MATLVARAGSGDAIAACQLAAELMDCRTRQLLGNHARRATEPRDPARCRALVDDHLDRHFDWLRQAAHAGEPEAMLRYAQGEGFGIPGASFAYLSSPRFDVWRREAPAMLGALLEAGYPEALIARIMANDPLMGGHLAGLLPPDPVDDLAYIELLLLVQDDPTLVGRMQERLSSGTDHVIREQAQQLAIRWHREYFNGQTYDFSQADAPHAFAMMEAQGKACSVLPGQTAP